MIIACGEALIDMVPEQDGRGRDIYIPCFGGSPYNTAIAAGRILGAPARTAFLSRLSRDFFGEALVQNLARNNVSTAFLARGNENTTLAFVHLEAGKEPAYLFYTEGTADFSFGPGDIPSSLSPGPGGCILFGSIALTMEPAASSIEAFVRRESRPGGPVISFDPNVRPMMIRDREAYLRRLEGWMRLSTIVKISAADIEFIYPGLEPDAAMNRILSLGPRLLAVTLGKDGALAVLNGKGVRVSAPAGRIQKAEGAEADTIGAGDTFHGALLAKLELQGNMSRDALENMGEGELRDVLVFANRAASMVCSRKGADPPALAELEGEQGLEEFSSPSPGVRVPPKDGVRASAGGVLDGGK